MPFWQDCIGCSGDCVGQAVSGTPAYWLFRGQFVTADGTFQTPEEAGVDVVSGDTLLVIGSPVLWYTTDGSAPLNGCGLFGPVGCGGLGTSQYGYAVIDGTVAAVPVNTLSASGGIQQPSTRFGDPIDPMPNWQFQAGGTGMSFTWTADGIEDDVPTAVFGTNDAIDNGVLYVAMQNQRTGVIYGWLDVISCFCV